MALPTHFSSQTELGLVRALPQLSCVVWDSLPCSDSEPHVLMQPRPQYRESKEQVADMVSLYQMQSCSFIITVTMLSASELEYLCARLIGHQDAGTWEWRPGERMLGARALAPRSWVSRASVLQHVQCVVHGLAAGIIQELVRNIESLPTSELLSQNPNFNKISMDLCGHFEEHWSTQPAYPTSVAHSQALTSQKFLGFF